MISFYTEAEVIEMLEIKNISEAIATGELPKNTAQSIHGERLWQCRTIDEMKEKTQCKTQ